MPSNSIQTANSQLGKNIISFVMALCRKHWHTHN